MDSVENIKKNRIRLTIYSIILIVLGMLLGIVAFKLYHMDQEKKEQEVSINNKKLADNKLLIVSEELLNNYSNYFEKILSNQDNSIKVTEAPAGYNGDDNYLKYFTPAENLENDLSKYFSKEITIDDLYTKYDYENNTIDEYDEIRPTYTEYEGKYYLDGICESYGNKALYSDFKIIERNDDKAKLNYKITIMSIVDESIMETYDNAELDLVYEDGAWKISKGTIIGRCGLTYSVK